MTGNRLIRKAAALAVIAAMVLSLTSCGGAKVPDKYDYSDLSVYLKLGKYKGLTYSKVTPQVTDDDVKDYIDSVIEQKSSTKEVKSGTVKKDSIVKIDYTGKINGKKFDGGSAEDYQLNIADSNFIDGFAEQIVGHKVGEKFDIDVTFPKNYSNNEELAGKKATFTVKVNSIVKTETPEYNDDFVKENTKYSTTEEYEKSIRKKLMKQEKQQAVSTEKQELFTKILTASKVKKYPEKETDDAYNNMIDTYKQLAKKNNTTYAKYIKSSTGMTRKQFEKQAKLAAKNTVKQELVLYSLADKFDIDISNKEYRDYLNNMLEEAGYDEDSFKSATGTTIEEYAEDNNLYDTMLYERVMNKVMKLSKAK